MACAEGGAQVVHKNIQRANRYKNEYVLAYFF